MYYATSRLQVLAPLDVLSVANLVNYIGKAETLTEVVIAPLLLRKGKTKVRHTRIVAYFRVLVFLHAQVVLSCALASLLSWLPPYVPSTHTSYNPGCAVWPG